MSDRATVVLALATAAGAWASWPVSRGVGLVLVVVAFAARRPVVLIVGAAVLASALGARAWDGLHPPLVGSWAGRVTLVSDPTWYGPAVRVDVRLRGKRVEAWARGEAAGRLEARLAGEQVTLRGTVRPVPARARRRLARRHVAARLSVTDVDDDWSPGSPVARAANGVRRTLARGTVTLPDAHRALFAGFVLGDDRDEPPEVASDFRAAGLAHLLAVSGQNVAFVLALAGPLLARLGHRPRLAMGIAVLLLFGVLTRWEPSVLRAVAMAALAMTATTLGRPASPVRRLALAVAGLLLVDPLLVGSVGFLLSAAASAGIAVLGPPLAGALPGPRPLAQAVAVTLAAQAGVAPVLLPVFGGLPVVSPVANLVAVPAAGPVMMWGLLAGLPAGLLGGVGATLLHLPTRLLVGWVALVARIAAALPLGQLGVPHVVVLTVLAAMNVARSSARSARQPSMFTNAVLVLAAATVFLPAVTFIWPGAVAGEEVARGARLWRSGGATVLVVDGADPGRLLDALRARGVRRLDVLVACRRGTIAGAAVRPLLRRLPVGVLLAPPGHALPGAVVPEPGTRVRAGPLTVAVRGAAPRLDVEVRRVGSRRAPGPG